MKTASHLVVLDFDGTWTLWPMEGNSHWSRMDRHVLNQEQLNRTQETRTYYMGMKAKGIWSEQLEKEWLEASIQVWIDAGLKREHIAECFGENAPFLRRGHRAMLERLKRQATGRVHVVINSYGIRDIITTILQAEGVLHLVDEVIAISLTYDDAGRVTGMDPSTLVNSRIKQERTREIMARLGVSESNTTGVGDTIGDAVIVPDGAHRLLLASSQEHADSFKRHFHDHVISPHDWSGVMTKLEQRFGF